jgi:hypothetical protein
MTDSPTVVDPGGPTRRRRASWGDEFDALAPGFNDALDKAFVSQMPLVDTVLTDGSTSLAVRIIVNQATNDLKDLVFELGSDSGRAAIRTSRAIVEHAINLHTVVASTSNADRYVDHLDRGPILMQDLGLGVELLKGNQRRAYAHALRTAGRDAGRRFANSLGKYGSAFRRQWAVDNIADRAKIFGLENHYTFYRIASLIAHGSASGTLGNMKKDSSGRITFRTGNSFELAPIAMLGGLRAYLAYLDALAVARPEIDFTGYRQAIEELIRLWPTYFAALSKIDRRMWPDSPTKAPYAAILIFRDGTAGWVLHLRETKVFMTATMPQLDAELKQDLEAFITALVSDRKRYFPSSGKPLAVGIPEIALSPDHDGLVTTEEHFLTFIDSAPEAANQLLDTYQRGLMRYMGGASFRAAPPMDS